MLRRDFLSLSLTAACFASAPAFALSDDDAAVLKQAEGYFNAIKTLKARFVQVNPDGKSVEGDLYVSRPGRMRLVYDPPSPILMVADGTFLNYVDTKMKDTSSVALGDTPAGLLLKQNLSFSDPTIKMGGVKFGAGTIEITAAMAKDPTAGKLTLIFTESPFEFKQWRVLDAQRKEVVVTLFDAKTGLKLDEKLFRDDSRRQQRNRD